MAPNDPGRDGRPAYDDGPGDFAPKGEPVDRSNPRGVKADLPANPEADAALRELGASIQSRGHSDHSPVAGQKAPVDQGTETDPANVDVKG